jgi:hypothetical protein
MKQRRKERPAAAPMYYLTRPAATWKRALEAHAATEPEADRPSGERPAA